MQKPDTFNITVGTDVIFNVRLVHEGEALNPLLVEDLVVNLVSGLANRNALDTTVNDEFVVVNVPWVEGRIPGCYSLELKGTINGLAWSSVGKGIIRYTSATEHGETNINVGGDPYDVTMELSYFYTESPIEKAVVSVDGNVGVPTVEYSYVNRKMTMDFHNLKGNGIASIEQTTISTEDKGVNVVTITDDKGTDSRIEIRNGGIGPTGRTGPQGQSAVFNPETGNISEIQQTKGDNANDPMSQKAITDALDDERMFARDGDVVSDNTDLFSGVGYLSGNRYVNGATGATPTSTGWKASNQIFVRGFDYVRVSVCNYSSIAGVAFYKSNGDYAGGVNGKGDYETSSVEYFDMILKVPTDAAYMRLSQRTSSQTEPYCYGIVTKGGISKVPGISDYVERLSKGDSHVEEVGWDYGYINTAGQYKSSTETCMTTYIEASKIKRIRKIENASALISLVFFDENKTWKMTFVDYSSDISVFPLDWPYLRIWFRYNDKNTANTQVEFSFYDGDIIEDLSSGVEDYRGNRLKLLNSIRSIGFGDLDLKFDNTCILFTADDVNDGDQISYDFDMLGDPSKSYAYFEALDENGVRMKDPLSTSTGDHTASWGHKSTTDSNTHYEGRFELPVGFKTLRLFLDNTSIILHSFGKNGHESEEQVSYVGKRINGLSFEDVSTIFSSNDIDASVYEQERISFGNVLKISDDMYYMYYYGMAYADRSHGSGGIDAYGHILFAYSSNGKDWTRGFPEGVTPPIEGQGNEVLVFKDKIAEQHVFKVIDGAYPYRMLASYAPESDYNKNLTGLWKSEDGIHWTFVRKLYNKCYDSQYNCIPRGQYIKTYMRTRSVNSNGSRYVGLMTIDIDGNIVTPPSEFGLPLYYNAGASPLDERRDILFATKYMDNATQLETPGCFIVDGEKVKKIDVDFSPLLMEWDKQIYVFPGLVDIEGETYIYYLTRTSNHNDSDQGVSHVRMAKVVFETEGFPKYTRN